jgi:hypothetical protein
LDVVSNVTVSAGATFGLIQDTPMPRYDFVTNGALFLTEPDGTQKMMGAVGQLRLGFLGPVIATGERSDSRVYGASFAMGGCLTPHYDSRGLIALFCVGYGGGMLAVEPQNSDLGEESVGFGFVNAGFDGQYNFSKYVHLGVRFGWEGYMLGDVSFERLRGMDGGANAFYGTVGLGVHF